MIINGASRSNGAFFSRHLMRADQNERVSVVELRGLAYAQDVPGAFREMKELAAGTSCKNYFYHANINTRPDEVLTPEQWAQAVDALERALQLDGQPRVIVEHDKEGRTHRHVVWSRIAVEQVPQEEIRAERPGEPQGEDPDRREPHPRVVVQPAGLDEVARPVVEAVEAGPPFDRSRVGPPQARLGREARPRVGEV